MSKRILHFDFPSGVHTVYIDGKRYTRSEFELAKKLESRRDKKGRFSSNSLRS